MRAARHALVIAVLGLVSAGACTNDYGTFRIGAGGTAGTGDTDASAGSGGASTGGMAGATGGSAGATGGAAGSAGATGGVGATGGSSSGAGGAGALGGGPGSDAAAGVGGSDPGVDGSVGGAAGADGGSGAASGLDAAPDVTWCGTPDTVEHCGACGRACSTAGTETLVCASGVCASSCQIGFGNCTQPPTGPDDGCETPTSANNSHCGGCGNVCTGLTCQGSLCGCGGDAACREGGPPGQAVCDTGTRRCTCSGTPCNVGERCNEGCRCNGGAACASGQTCCSTGCFDLATDASHCGACHRPCAPGQTCVAGQCQL
jgi:hypothetical protein